MVHENIPSNHTPWLKIQ